MRTLSLAEERLVIEIDGAPHFTANGARHEAARDAWMESRRNDTQGVLEQIRNVLRAIEADRRPSPPASASADLQYLLHSNPFSPLPLRERGRG
jgi:hypothetical protein